MAFRTFPMLAACLLATTAIMPARAAEDDPPSAAALATKAIQDQAAYEKARLDLARQRIDALGLKTDTTGKTELKDKAGSFEGWLLSANAIEKAADTIAARIRADDVLKARTLVLLAGDEPFDLSLPASMLDRLRALEREAGTGRTLAGCDGKKPSPLVDGAAPDDTVAALPVAVLPAIGALLGAIRTDTEISGIEGPTEARLIVHALAGHAPTDPAGPTWMIPGDYTLIDAGSPAAPDPTKDVRAAWNALVEARTTVVKCRVEVAAGKDPAVAKERAALLDGWLASFAAFEQSAVLAGTGPSPLIQAIRLQGIAGTSPMILRVYLEKAGGSVLVRRNLFTALGAPAVGITGGAVVGWRAIDPRSGGIRGGGNLSCRTGLTSMRAVHDGRARTASCDWIEQGAGRARP